MSGIRHDFDDGKYTVVFDTEKNPSLYALRHGEPWPARDLVGDKMVLAMLFEVDDLKKHALSLAGEMSRFGSENLELKRQNAVLLEYFNASVAFSNTVGHEEATVEDERKAEERFDAATLAVRAALKKAGAA